jgi:hypothetical protein
MAAGPAGVAGGVVSGWAQTAAETAAARRAGSARAERKVIGIS